MEASSLEAHSTFANERKWAVFYRDVVDGKAATAERKFVRDDNKTLCYIAPVLDTKLALTGVTDNLKTCELPDSGMTEDR